VLAWKIEVRLILLLWKSKQLTYGKYFAIGRSPRLSAYLPKCPQTSCPPRGPKYEVVGRDNSPRGLWQIRNEVGSGQRPTAFSALGKFQLYWPDWWQHYFEM
jgi:hypothetical protein